ncbi:cytochrome P450 [Saccharopolyspora erythraea NRRL 2338]|uniref:Cytochrome P450 hydroxylase n=2 Tax=Saccharopolyspora erythraea TaxID=1836 RepID=A4FDJ6_SACEN|nr:cytochrome P450 [Saccharopolyspora erythraea]EQD82738.1 cytochrome P450 [Saccharopolyspora erythraea D]PFG95857.1 cytochrome P450 [Saccharopolyspora erythraea NRRL 2338]QRK92433.1 cytochrome P450 [Saccharopolyspora erythraea]CAM02121.1 cytochrome P450 hydroxylase [Saccharopolyspora erythraea NRRL 2338]
MTSTLDESTPDYPMPRARGCPFDPPPALRDLQRETPMARVRLWDGSTPWLVTRYADQRAVLRDSHVSADMNHPTYPRQAPGGGTLSFIGMDDPEHARLRRMVGSAFAVKNVERMRPWVQRIVDEAVDELLAGPRPADLVEEFALPVPSLVICGLLDVPYADHAFFQSNSKTMINRDSTPEQRSQASGRLAEYLSDLLSSKMDTRGDDLRSRLCGRIEAGDLTLRQATEMAVLLLIAGHETTANMIALSTLLLLRHPDQLALLRESDDPDVARRAVEEMLRYLNITHGGRRRVALEDVEVAGQRVRAGEGLVLPNEIANRDPDAFPDPDRLDITREARHHVAFGFGVHQCLGQPLARLELEIVYRTLYRRAPRLALAAGIEDIPFKHDGFVYGVYELPVTW